MKAILLNPVVLSVTFLYVLCLKRVNVLLAILLSTVFAGMLAGMPLKTIMDTLVAGMGSNTETALSYILLGTFAASMMHTGFSQWLSAHIARWVGNRRSILLTIFTCVAVASQNIVPIHIAFIPMLVPPLLGMMNRLQIDRRAVACALAFGLKMPYIVIPAGFGIIFQNLLADAISQNGLAVQSVDIWKSNYILGIGMTIGLLIALGISYRVPRVYKDVGPLNAQATPFVETRFKKSYGIILLAIISAFVIQIWTHSLPLGALTGLGILFLLRAVEQPAMDAMMYDGIRMMGFVAFVLLAAAGFANVLKATGGIDSLIQALIPILPENKLISSFALLLVGLLITMSIGSSFGTIPILATFMVPLCLQMQFNTRQIIVLMAAAAALGDAGSPQSDTTLGPTSGLNADGQHDHIRDTCIPTFLHYNIALIISALIGVTVF